MTTTDTKKIVVLGGGTLSHVRSHLALCAPAYGTTARRLAQALPAELADQGLAERFSVNLRLTRMADPASPLVTNDDVSDLVDELVADPATAAVVMTAALADFTGRIGQTPSGSHAPRLRTAEGATSIEIAPAPKIIGRIAAARPDVLVVGFKTTSGQTPETSESLARDMSRTSGARLVLANDVITRINSVVADERLLVRTHYRGKALRTLSTRLVYELGLTREDRL